MVNAINKNGQRIDRLERVQMETTLLIREIIEIQKNVTDEVTFRTEKFMDKMYFYCMGNRDVSDLRDIDITIPNLFRVLQIELDVLKDTTMNLVNNFERALLGKISKLISEKNFTNDLFYVNSILDSFDCLPINLYEDNAMHILEYARVSGAIYDDKMLLEITFPALTHLAFNIFKIIPIPVFLNNYTIIIQPSIDYLLIDSVKSQYVALSENELLN